MRCLVTDVCVNKSAELFEHFFFSTVFNVIGTVDMALNWYVVYLCVMVTCVQICVVC